MSFVIDAAQFGVLPESTDNTLALQSALIACRSRNDGDAATLRFAPGIYHFRPEFAVERLCWISNNDGGVRRIAFPLLGDTNLAIDGGGAEFVFHGEIIPFLVEGSSAVTLQNFSVDWPEPVTLTGTVSDVTADGWVTLALDPDGTGKIEPDGRLTICGQGWETSVAGYIELDPATKAPAYGTGDVWRNGKPGGWDHSFEAIEPHSLRFRFPGLAPQIGHHLVFLRGDRRNPGIFLTESNDVQVTDVTIYQATAMALIAQRCTNVTAERFRVELRPGTERLVTATADATHFVGCRGTIRLIDCLFEGQLDDPANIHGTYAKIDAWLGPHELLLRRMHEQQKGVPFAGPGDQLAFYFPDTMELFTNATVNTIREINADFFVVTLIEPQESAIQLFRVVENLSWTPDVEIRGCIAQRNRARGFLISTPGKVLIENNTLSTGGAGILIPGDCDYWFESGAVRDVLIRDNTFQNCNMGHWGIATIDITPKVKLDESRGPFHRNIRIEGNRFVTFQKAIVAAWSVDGFTFRDNEIVQTGEHAPFGTQEEAVAVRGCRNVVVAGV